MVADSDDYIALQNVYVNKARDDCASVSASVKESLSASQSQIFLHFYIFLHILT